MRVGKVEPHQLINKVLAELRLSQANELETNPSMWTKAKYELAYTDASDISTVCIQVRRPDRDPHRIRLSIVPTEEDLKFIELLVLKSVLSGNKGLG